jgi:hypothetical protein
MSVHSLDKLDPDRKISIDDAAIELSTILDKYDWYYDVHIVNDTIEVIVKNMNAEILGIVPSKLYGFTVGMTYLSYHFNQSESLDRLVQAIFEIDV